jgi:hypothetical protein
MTEIESIRHIKIAKQFPKTFDDYFNYFNPIFFIFFSGVAVYGFFKSHGQLTFELILILFFCFGVAFTFLTFIRLNDNIKFRTVSVDTNIDIDKIAERLKERFRLIRIIVNKDLGKIEAFTQSRSFSWGEKLTLIWTEDAILINSRPSGYLQAFTIFEDRKNIRKLEQLLS